MKRIAFVIFLIIFLGGAALLWWRNGNEAVNSRDNSQKIFVIEKGAAVRTVGNKLKAAGLIRDPIVFFIVIKQQGKDKAIQAGDYRLSPSMSLQKIIDTLEHGILDKWITFREGLRAEEYAQVLAENFPQYNDSWVGVLRANEGYLFPDTYLIPKDADIDMIISFLRTTFFTKVRALGLSESSPNLRQTIILASLLEREARSASEKPVISGIFQNRLRAGMPLQVDATVQYAKGYDTLKKSWWPTVYIEDYRGVLSSYNTYLNPGLPPGPISNPGIASLEAAIHPVETQYLYYLHDRHGVIHYARTSAEHAQNVAKYID